MQIEFDDRYFMQKALAEARLAFEKDEVPVGAVVVLGNRIIGRGYNLTETLNDPTAHAEIIALTAAFSSLGAKYLPEAVIYISLEPCHMCAGALYWSKIGRIVYAAPDEKHGYRRFYGAHFPFHPKTVVQHGLLADEGAALMQSFFKKKRTLL